MWQIKSKSPINSLAISPDFKAKDMKNKDRNERKSIRKKEGLPNQSLNYTIKQIYENDTHALEYENLHGQENWSINIQETEYLISIYTIIAIYEVIFNGRNDINESPLINPEILGEIITFKPYRKPIKLSLNKTLKPCCFLSKNDKKKNIESPEKTFEIINFLIDGSI